VVQSNGELYRVLSKHSPRVVPKSSRPCDNRQQAGKAWLGTHLNYITPIRFGVGDADKGATECRESMSDQLTVFSS